MPFPGPASGLEGPIPFPGATAHKILLPYTRSKKTNMKRRRNEEAVKGEESTTEKTHEKRRNTLTGTGSPHCTGLPLSPLGVVVGTTSDQVG